MSDERPHSMDHTHRPNNKIPHGVALFAAVVAMAVVFVVDMLTPLGITVWVGYLLPIWYVSRLSLQGIVLTSVTLTCTALIVVGYLLSPPGVSPLISVSNRMVGAVFLWTMTLVLLRSQAADKRVELAQERLQQSEAQYRELIQSLPTAVYTCDAHGRILLYNHAAVALWGQEPEAGKDLWYGSWKIYRPDGTPLPLEDSPMELTLREGRAIRGEEIVVERPDGTRRHVLLHPEPIRNANGATVGAVNVLIDITDRQEAERAVAKLAAIVTSSQDAIVSKNLQGIVTSWNRAAERLFGYTEGEMIGQSVKRLIPPDRYEEETRILQHIRRKEPVDHYETIRRRKDGIDVQVSLTVSPVVDSQGRVIGASKIARDISEQKRAEEALRDRDCALMAANETLKKQTKALVEANKELEGFSYSVSHDLRAPLRTIDAFSRIVEEESGSQLNADARRCLQVVRKAVGQAGELIDDLLEFSKLGRQAMEFRSVQMADLAREAAQELRTVKESRKIHLILPDLPPCRGDHRLLKLVWINLVSNAFKYTKNREEARIEIGWMPDDSGPDTHIYYVKDNGVGFDMKYRHKLFGVFQRLHRQEDFEGSGVGLAIVQRIVYRHEGRVWAEGKIDDGATFYFSLRKA
ncbi:MAG: PAS domain S-box protein [Nitrospirota bacterium]